MRVSPPQQPVALLAMILGMEHAHRSPHTSFKLNCICLQEHQRFADREIYCSKCYKRSAVTSHYTVKASHYTLQT